MRLLATIAAAVVIYVILLRGSSPTPLLPPGYGKRFDTPFWRKWYAEHSEEARRAREGKRP